MLFGYLYCYFYFFHFLFMPATKVFEKEEKFFNTLTLPLTHKYSTHVLLSHSLLKYKPAN